LALLNSPVTSVISKEFINSTNYEMNDLRQLPVVVPDANSSKEIEDEVNRLLGLARKGNRDEVGEVPSLIAGCLGVAEFEPFQVTH
jgi:hypothetical protein